MPDRQQITITPTADEDHAIATITIAFSNDPVVRWIFRSASRYLTYWPQFVKEFARPAFAAGTADSADDCRGVAIWLPPGVVADDEALGTIAAAGIPVVEHDEVFAFLAQIPDFHPTEPHWYLPLIGVDVTARGSGYGSALLRHALERCDRDRVPAYLEATSPQNKALYEHHGFEACGVIQAGDSPPMWPMLRTP